MLSITFSVSEKNNAADARTEECISTDCVYGDQQAVRVRRREDEVL